MPLLIDSDVFQVITFSLADISQVNLTLTVDPFCDSVDGESMLEALTVWVSFHNELILYNKITMHVPNLPCHLMFMLCIFCTICYAMYCLLYYNVAEVLCYYFGFYF